MTLARRRFFTIGLSLLAANFLFPPWIRYSVESMGYALVFIGPREWSWEPPKEVSLLDQLAQNGPLSDDAKARVLERANDSAKELIQEGTYTANDFDPTQGNRQIKLSVITKAMNDLGITTRTIDDVRAERAQGPHSIGRSVRLPVENCSIDLKRLAVQTLAIVCLMGIALLGWADRRPRGLGV